MITAMAAPMSASARKNSRAGLCAAGSRAADIFFNSGIGVGLGLMRVIGTICGTSALTAGRHCSISSTRWVGEIGRFAGSFSSMCASRPTAHRGRPGSSSKGGELCNALDEPFSVNDSENEKVGIKSVSNRDKDEVKKTAKRSVKRPQQRVTSRDRDRGFSPLQELQRAREKIRRTIRRIL